MPELSSETLDQLASLIADRIAEKLRIPDPVLNRANAAKFLGVTTRTSGPTGDRWRTYQGEVWNQNCFPGFRPSGIDRTEIGKYSLRGLHN